MEDTTKFSSLPKLEINGIVFPPAARPPGSSKSLFLAGAGVRGLDIGGKFIAFTGIGVYLEEDAVNKMEGKWKGKDAEELQNNKDFFRNICTGDFEKFTRVTMILPLTGQQYSEKVSENCINAWKAAGIYSEAEEAAIEKFMNIFKDQNFPPGSSILFTHSATGSLTIAFSKDGSIPEAGNVVIDNRILCESILESIIGEHGVSPAAKRSLAERLFELMKESEEKIKADEPATVTV